MFPMRVVDAQSLSPDYEVIGVSHPFQGPTVLMREDRNARAND